MNGSKLWILKDDHKHNIQNTSVCTKEYSTQGCKKVLKLMTDLSK